MFSSLSSTLMRISNSSVVKRVKQSFIPSSIEMACGIGFSYATSLFLQPGASWLVNPFFSTSILTTFNFLLRSIPQGSYEIHLRQMRSFLFALVDVYQRGTLTHEGSHALLTYLIYNNPHPNVIIKPSFIYNDAITQYTPDSSELATKLGDPAARFLIASAGTGGTLLFSWLSLIVHHAMPDNYPEIKSHLRFSIAATTLRHLIYSLTPYLSDCNTDMTNDFCRLEEQGLSPSVAALIIVSTLGLMQLSIYGSSKLLNKIKECRKANPTIEDLEAGQSLLELEPAENLSLKMKL